MHLIKLTIQLHLSVHVFAKLIVQGNKLYEGDDIKVRWGTQGDIYDAKVKGFFRGTMVRVRFKNMTADWDRWVPIERVVRIVDFGSNV